MIQNSNSRPGVQAKRPNKVKVPTPVFFITTKGRIVIFASCHSISELNDALASFSGNVKIDFTNKPKVRWPVAHSWRN